MTTKSILALIPARGGSKGLPNKNIATLNRIPLIAYSISAGKKAKLVSKTVVSTDSKKIAGISKKYGADVPFLRPAKFATDKSPTIDAVLHALDYLKNNGENYDAVALLEPTSPLRKQGDIDNAVSMLIKNWNKTDAVVSLGEIRLENPFIAKKIKKARIVPIINVGKITRRQDLPKAYFPYGVIYLCKTSVLKKERTFYPKRVMPYLIERWQNYEIDDMFDLMAVNAVMKHKKIKL